MLLGKIPKISLVITGEFIYFLDSNILTCNLNKAIAPRFKIYQLLEGKTSTVHPINGLDC